MNDDSIYQEYLHNPTFIKYGIVVSHLVWRKSYSQIEAALSVSKPYISQIMTRWRSEGCFDDKR